MRPSIEYLPYSLGTACEKCGCAYSAHDSGYVHGPCHGVQAHETKPDDAESPFWSVTYNRWVTLCCCTSFRACPDFREAADPCQPRTQGSLDRARPDAVTETGPSNTARPGTTINPKETTPSC